jgi:hypothetical protein
MCRAEYASADPFHEDCFKASIRPSTCPTPFGAGSVTPSAASGGSNPKAPGFAGGYLHVSASTLRRIAEEQQPMTGADFAQWRVALGLSLTEAATLLGVGRRTIMGYLNKDELPPLVAIACRALARDKHLLAAHYVPARKIARPAA